MASRESSEQGGVSGDGDEGDGDEGDGDEDARPIHKMQDSGQIVVPQSVRERVSARYFAFEITDDGAIKMDPKWT